MSPSAICVISALFVRRPCPTAASTGSLTAVYQPPYNAAQGPPDKYRCFSGPPSIQASPSPSPAQLTQKEILILGEATDLSRIDDHDKHRTFRRTGCKMQRQLSAKAMEMACLHYLQDQGFGQITYCPESKLSHASDPANTHAHTHSQA